MSVATNLIDLNGGARVLDDDRHALAVRAAGDITEVVKVLANFRDDDLEPAVVQMVQQRIHALACGVLSAIDDPGHPLAEIQARLYPDEKEPPWQTALSGGGHNAARAR